MKIERCPTCKQSVKPIARIRYCAKCQRPLTVHAKWHFVFRGKSVQMQHRNCDSPEEYVRTR